MRNENVKNLILFCSLTLFLTGCGIGNKSSEITNQPSEIIEETNMGKARISEIMSRNKATLQSEYGDFPDWIEIENLTDKPLNLDGWYISDRIDEGYRFSNITIDANQRIVVFADKNESTNTEIHTGFGIKEGETVYLKDKNDDVVCSLTVDKDEADVSISFDGDKYTNCYYPTPNKENKIESYNELQSNRTVLGPIQINEVSVENFKYFYSGEDIEYPDWLEIKNVSNDPTNLKDYFISDDSANPYVFQLPDEVLQPGELKVILCDKKAEKYSGSYTMAPFSLDSENDRLYLTDINGITVDYVALKDIPLNKTYGRLPNENGYFYLDSQTPEEENNCDGKRYVAQTPVSSTQGGVFNDVSGIKVELYSEGDIYYTLDSTLPSKKTSTKYTKPIEIDKTTILRAITVLDDAIDSRPLTLSFIVNENHTLPVVSLVTDDKEKFGSMYRNGYKLEETPGYISYYDENGSFSLGCGIKMHGDTSLVLYKPGMSVRFRGAYGQSELNYELFGGNVTNFTNLLLRGGQDQLDTIVRNEAIINLALQCSDNLVCQRSKYCILYIDGQYSGIRALMEKSNEQLYASLYNVEKEKVIENEAAVNTEDLFYKEVVYDIIYGDMSDDNQYLNVCQKLDIDSLIDWIVVEGWSGNFDLASGNLRYIKSTVNGDKWKLELYDLDCGLINSDFCYAYVTNYPNQIGQIVLELLKNNIFREKLFTRVNELTKTTLSNENVIAELDRLYEIIDSEVKRDEEISLMSYDSWKKHTEDLERKILEYDWANMSIEKLCDQASVTLEERTKYFGQ